MDCATSMQSCKLLSTQYSSSDNFSSWFFQLIESQQFDRAFNECRHHRSAQSPLLRLCELIPMTQKSSSRLHFDERSRLHFANDRPATLSDRDATQQQRCDSDAS